MLPAKEIGRRIAAAREAAGLKQRELATRLGKSQNEVSRWENGRVTPQYDTVVMLAKALGVAVADLIGESPAPATPTPTADEALWAAELRAAERRARALEELATAERIHAEASRARGRAEEIRAEALRAQSQAAENDSGRARDARPEMHLIREWTDREWDRVAAFIVDRLEAKRIAQGEPPAPPQSPGEERAG